MAYTFSVNNTPTNGTVAIWAVITTLKSAGWSQLDSGDGITTGHGDGYVTSANSGAGGLGNTGAWVRLRAPAVNGGAVVNQTREVLFQRGTTETAWRLKYSASAGFVGGSPTKTVSSTAADQVVMMGSGTDASPGYSTFFGAGGTYRWHICCGGAAEFYSFYAFGINASMALLTSGGSIGFYMDVLALGTYPPEDVDPCVFYCSGAYASSNFFSTGHFNYTSLNAVATDTNNALMRAWMGPTSQADVSITTNNVGITIPYYNQYLGSSTPYAGANPFNHKAVSVPCWYMRSILSTPPFGIKGASTLIVFSSLSAALLDTVDVFSTRDKIVIYSTGPFWLPWNGSIPLI